MFGTVLVVHIVHGVKSEKRYNVCSPRFSRCRRDRQLHAEAGAGAEIAQQDQPARPRRRKDFRLLSHREQNKEPDLPTDDLVSLQPTETTTAPSLLHVSGRAFFRRYVGGMRVGPT